MLIESQIAMYSKKQISLSNKSNESQVEKILKNDKLVNNGIDPEQIKQARK